MFFQLFGFHVNNSCFRGGEVVESVYLRVYKINFHVLNNLFHSNEVDWTNRSFVRSIVHPLARFDVLFIVTNETESLHEHHCFYVIFHKYINIYIINKESGKLKSIIFVPLSIKPSSLYRNVNGKIHKITKVTNWNYDYKEIKIFISVQRR